MKKSLFFALLLLLCHAASHSKGEAYFGISSKEMHSLCAKVYKKFSPLPESIRAPNKDPLFNSIEFNKNEAEILRSINNRHPDQIIIDGMTPLMAASYTGNWNASRLLLSKGADINFVKFPDITTTPLLTALLNQQFALSCQLIAHGANLPVDDDDRYSIIRNTLITTVDNEIDGATMLDFFLANGFNSNNMGSGLETPLMRAVSVNSIPAIKVLLKHGASLDIVKQDGRTVWTVAREKNNPQVLKLLKEAQKKAKPRKRSHATLTPATA